MTLNIITNNKGGKRMNFKLKHFTSIWNRENLNNLNNLVDFVQNFVESKGEALFDAETFATWLSENKIERSGSNAIEFTYRPKYF